jgi:hypothetical protein
MKIYGQLFAGPPVPAQRALERSGERLVARRNACSTPGVPFEANDAFEHA